MYVFSMNNNNNNSNNNMNTLVICVVYVSRIAIILPNCLSVLKKACGRQVVSDKWSPLLGDNNNNKKKKKNNNKHDKHSSIRQVVSDKWFPPIYPRARHISCCTRSFCPAK